MIIKGKYDKAVVYTENIEETAIEQIKEYLDQECFKGTNTRVMPDTHSGKGCVIGFTSRLNGYIVPNLIGVDIGCGVLSVNLGKIDIDLEALDIFIHKNIPAGFNVYNQKKEDITILRNMYCYNELINVDHIEKSLGTLGGGNHFIEIDIDEDGNKYLLIHTGSRNLGKQVATLYQNMAETYRVENNIDIPKHLAYLKDSDRHKYFRDFKICVLFARVNRKEIAKTILDGFFGMNLEDKEQIDTIHNYIDRNNIVRKGAISAQKEEKVIIPLNMGAGALLCVGKGNEEWNYSAPHGAGRIMSRRKAKESIDLDDYKRTMESIYTSSVSINTIDEAPMCYKNADEIKNAIGDTVDIIKHIRPIYNFKA